LSIQCGSAPADWQEFFRELFASCDVLPVTEEIALAAAEVNCALRAPLKAPDALIAAVASAAGAVLVTADDRFLRLPGLEVEFVRPSLTWSAAAICRRHPPPCHGRSTVSEIPLAPTVTALAASNGGASRISTAWESAVVNSETSLRASSICRA
jgi:hypothetical protein